MRSRGTSLRIALLWALTAVSACAGAPVQEMSDARQAIRAAQNAGAADKAPEAFQEAQLLLGAAEQSLRRGAYREARRAAEDARDRAAVALAATRTTT
jgi:hypothetical protein